MKTYPMPTFAPPNYVYRVEVERIIDGDTIDVRIDVGFKTFVFKRLRFLGINAFEVHGEEKEKGLAAKARLEELLSQADNVYIQTVMDATGKYGRVLAWIWTDVDGVMNNVNEILLEEGHGVVYP